MHNAAEQSVIEERNQYGEEQKHEEAGAYKNGDKPSVISISRNKGGGRGTEKMRNLWILPGPDRCGAVLTNNTVRANSVYASSLIREYFTRGVTENPRAGEREGERMKCTLRSHETTL